MHSGKKITVIYKVNIKVNISSYISQHRRIENLQTYLILYPILYVTQVNEGVREKENSDRLEWLQSHIICDGLEEQLIFNSLTNSLGPRKLLHFGILHKVTNTSLGMSKIFVPHDFTVVILLQSKSGKELVSFLTNDFLLFVQPIKFSLNCHQFSFERNEHQKFKMYRKVYIKSSKRIIQVKVSHVITIRYRKADFSFVADISQ